MPTEAYLRDIFQRFSNIILILDNWKSGILPKLLFILLFYVLGITVYIHLENWTIPDCIYFITVTITTVGYGDFHPTTNESRLFTIFFIIVSWIFVFAVLNQAISDSIDYATMRAIQKIETVNQKSLKMKIRLSVLSIISWIMLGTILMAFIEDRSFVDSFYFAVVSASTIGYGDIVPKTVTGKIFISFYLFMSVITIATAITNIETIRHEIILQKKSEEMMAKRLDFAWLQELDADRGGGVDKLEFLVGILSHLGKLDYQEDVEPWLKRFDELDRDGSGSLDQQDLVLFAEEEQKRIEEERSRFLDEHNSSSSIYIRPAPSNNNSSSRNINGIIDSREYSPLTNIITTK